MPEAEEILASLERIANGATTVAMAWHVLLLLGVAAMVAGLRPSPRALAWTCLVPSPPVPQ